MSWCGGGEMSVTPGGGAAQPGDVRRDLVAGQLAALARLGALGDLDLELLRVGQVGRS